jgi:UPF0716 family protein affecting phage T7 exclusion
MPPLSQPQVIGWLLLFIPGFVSLTVAAWLGWAATRRTQLLAGPALKVKHPALRWL